jgi:hypothetical protein
MSNEELTGRIAALEVIATTALGSHLAQARKDPDSCTAANLGSRIAAPIAPPSGRR